MTATTGFIDLLHTKRMLGLFMGKRYVVRLTGPERALVTPLANNPAEPTRLRLWAAILLAADSGQCDQTIATKLATSVATVQRTRRRFVLKGVASLGQNTGDERPSPIVLGSQSWVHEVLRQTRTMAGVQRAALLNWEQQTCMGQVGTRDASWCDEATAFLHAMVQALPANERLEQLALTAPTHYQLFHVLSPAYPVVLNVIVNRHAGNLALARHQIEMIAHCIVD